jgi:hypothetical protein
MIERPATRPLIFLVLANLVVTSVLLGIVLAKGLGCS